MKPTMIRRTTPAEMLASIKAKVEARAAMSPEERATQDAKTAEILKKMGADAPTTLIVR